MKKNLKPITGLLAFFFLISSCSKVPLTGRRQTNIVPESELVAMSLTEYSSFLSTNKVVNTGNDAQMVKNAGAKISAAVTQYMNQHNLGKRIKGYKWEFNLVQDNTINAWCMPGGKVVFYSGIIPVCQDETGIAVVMGHEIAHAIARHGNERMSQGLLTQAGGVALSIYVMDKPAETRQLFNMAYGLGTNLAVLLPYSRLHESEADKMGLMFMAMAGYDPSAAPKFWERMSAQGGGRPPQFLSTHPNPEKRVSDLNKNLPEAMKYYQKAKN